MGSSLTSIHPSAARLTSVSDSNLQETQECQVKAGHEGSRAKAQGGRKDGHLRQGTVDQRASQDGIVRVGAGLSSVLPSHQPQLLSNHDLLTSYPCRLDQMQLKKPDAIAFSKANAVLPFEDSTSLAFWSHKNDASLFLVGTHSKKRPNNLVFARTYDSQVLDLLEVGIEGCKSMSDFKVS